jgi:Met-zincin
VVVKVQPDNADFDTLDINVASVRWITNAQAVFGAIGPSQVDPRSGEILDADISIESLSARSLRNLRAQIIGSDKDWQALMQFGATQQQGTSAYLRHGAQACEHADHAAEQLGYALDVLEARGEVDPSSPEAERFVLDYLTDVTMHEVGHTLGLRHNFRSSKIYSEAQLSDRDFTIKNGLAGSVMEYAPINLPRPREQGGTPFQAVLGPYDFWAIEYGYKPVPSAQEEAELKKIAARSAEPQLAYGTDEDNFLGVDPDTLHFDLGTDSVAYARKRFEIAADVIRRQEMRTLKPDEDYSALGRSVSYAMRDMGRSAGILARQIGGLRTLRDFPNTGRDPLQPVDGKVQREALDVLASGVFAADSVTLSPTLQRRLAPDFLDRTDIVFEGGSPNASHSVVPAVIGLQRALLGQLMSDTLASRIIDNAAKTDPKASPLMLSELYSRLAREIWSDLANKEDIAPLRRELQREYINRLSMQLLRPGAASRADTRSLLRAQAQTLLTRIQSASTRAALSAESRAHLADSADSLKQALDAKLQRLGV